MEKKDPIKPKKEGSKIFKRELAPEQKRERGRSMIAKLLMERAEEQDKPNLFQVLKDLNSVEVKKNEAAEKEKRENELWEEFVL
ncbi:MAG: hypothetical protein PF485_14910 [Bacteroidales bacterium]|jgi:hypothetical protein|nr:hypothetical protein [Bacteroidales bacterium]